MLFPNSHAEISISPSWWIRRENRRWYLQRSKNVLCTARFSYWPEKSEVDLMDKDSWEEDGCWLELEAWQAEETAEEAGGKKEREREIKEESDENERRRDDESILIGDCDRASDGQRATEQSGEREIDQREVEAELSWSGLYLYRITVQRLPCFMSYYRLHYLIRYWSLFFFSLSIN